MDTRLQEYLLSHALEGIVTTDLAGTILGCNETACRILGHPEESLRGEHLGLLFPEASVTHLLPNLMHLARETACFDGDIILRSADGSDVMIRLLAQAWPPKKPDLLLFRFLDWREVHDIVRQLRESSQMATLGTFARSLSHEILNPVTVIGAYARRLLRGEGVETEREEWSRQVLASVLRLEDLVGTVRNYLDLPSPSFVKGPLDDILDRAVRNIRTYAEENCVFIHADDVDVLPAVYHDPRLLETALTATFVNALERMPDGGKLIVEKKSSRDGGTISIHDTGPSLDPKQIEEDLSPVHVIGGERFHLNLAIAHRIVDIHGGKLALESSDHEGLTVRISIPADRRVVARNREL